MSEIARNLTSRKSIGRCSICDCRIADFLNTYPQGHFCAGEAQRIDRPHDEAVRVTLILSNGNTMDITVCPGCDRFVETGLVVLWKRILLGFKHETSNEFREGMRLPPYTATQRITVNSWIREMARIIPFGVLYRRNWKDVE